MKPQHSLNTYARKLRNNATDTERLLWRHLRNSQLEGIKFRRQQPIEAYIVDFISFDKKIIIELDGGQHSENVDYDEQRDACLSANGFVVLRFWNNDVIENIEGVMDVIRQHCLQLLPPPPDPLPPGEGEVFSFCCRSNGFTLVEMLVIMVLISISVALVYPSMHDLREKFDTLIEKADADKNVKKETFTRFVSDGFIYKPLSSAIKP